MRKIDFPRDQSFYNLKHKASDKYRDEPLDLFRFDLLLKLYRTIDRGNSLFRNKSVLNVAGGYGRESYLMLIEEPKSLVLCDYSLRQLRQAKKYLEGFSEKYILCCDGEGLPFKDKSFDICYITEALHHFIRPHKGIEEFIRVTKETIIIDEPCGGIVRGILNWIFIFLGIKEKYERGYLEAPRINKKKLKGFCLKYKLNLVFFPYFIYYFGWYKREKSNFIKLTYKNILFILNILFHSFGNRAIAILVFK